MTNRSAIGPFFATFSNARVVCLGLLRAIVICSCIAPFSGAGALGQESDAASDSESSGMKASFQKVVDGIEIERQVVGQSSFQRVPQPLLSWSNPQRQTFAGAMYLWTDHRRPAAAACVYPNPKLDSTLDVEFHSLSSEPLSATSDGSVVWQPSTAGIEWMSGAKLVTPAKTRVARLRQMRQLAREFSSQLVPPTKNPVPLRLLDTPVYRYQRDDSAINVTDDLIEGAIFLFVQGTDPEVILILEAVEGKSKDEWRYALARMTMVPMEVRRNETLVMETRWAVRRLSTPYYSYQVLVD